MIDLDATYLRLARSWTHEQLTAAYQQAAQRGAGLVEEGRGDELTRPIALLASAFPAAATLSVAVNMVHVVPDGARAGLADELIAAAEKNAAAALHRCHHALELDAEDHGHTAADWRAIVYDIAGSQLQSACRDQEPPTVVRHAQEAVSWLSRSIVEIDLSSAEATAAIAEALARLLTVWLFADQARGRDRELPS